MPARSASPLAYFVLVFALALPFWLVGAIRGGELAPGLPVSALQTLCPAIAVLLLLSRGAARQQLGQFIRRALVPRGRPKWYLLAVLLGPLIAALAYGVLRATGRDLPPAAISAGTAVALAFLFLLAALAEELGWSAYALPPLLERSTPFRAALLIGLVWAVWHWYPLVQAHRSPGWIAWWSLGTVMSRVILVWLYNNTSATVAAPALLHAGQNLSWQLFPYRGSHYDPMVTALLTGLATLIVMRSSPHRQGPST